MAENEGKCWRTIEHETHVEYQSVIKDVVLVSEYLAGHFGYKEGSLSFKRAGQLRTQKVLSVLSKGSEQQNRSRYQFSSHTA